MVTRLLWRSRTSKKVRAAAVEAARQAGFPRAKDDGEALRIIHRREQGVGLVWIFLLSRIFTNMEVV